VKYIMTENNTFEKPNNQPKPLRGRKMDLISGHWYDYECFTVDTIKGESKDEK